MATPRDLADRFHAEWLAANPLEASTLGVPGFDDRVPDASAAGIASWRGQVEAIVGDATQLDAAALDLDDSVTLGVLLEHAHQELAAIDIAADDYTVTAMPFAGPPVFLAVLARSVLPDAQAAEDYVSRLRAGGTYIDQLTDHLRAGAARNRLPVAPLVEQAIAWGEALLSLPVPDAVTAPQPPQAWDGEPAWRSARDDAAREVLAPALHRWVDELRALLPRSRPGTQPGLCFLDGGQELYGRAVRVHTTLALSAEVLHQTGLAHIEALEARALELGGQMGLTDLPSIYEALRASAGRMSPEEAMAAARAAVATAESRAGEVFPAPLPDPCAVQPMPEVVGESGVAPHYTPPRLDGTRPGTYWFNTVRPTAGTGWDLEGVAFHEAVPGHHLQLSRVQLLTGLPDLQRLRHLTVFGEGWGLYAEQLAEEMGLYTGPEGLLGATSASLQRAGRLVVDTGIHAFGWSRDRALRWFVDHVPMPIAFLEREIDRYIAMPGQALSYLTGKLEILELRDEARQRLGQRFTLPGFHATVLDHGSLPMPVLRQVVTAWEGAAP
jgi:uncharacterized protein (DUF885 family)